MQALISANSTLTDRYQTTIPEVIRNILSLEKRDKLSYFVDECGRVILSKAHVEQNDPVLDNFLKFLAKDIENSPQHLVPFTEKQAQEISSLVGDEVVDLNSPCEDDDDI